MRTASRAAPAAQPPCSPGLLGNFPASSRNRSSLDPDLQGNDRCGEHGRGVVASSAIVGSVGSSARLLVAVVVAVALGAMFACSTRGSTATSGPPGPSSSTAAPVSSGQAQLPGATSSPQATAVSALTADVPTDAPAPSSSPQATAVSALTAAVPTPAPTSASAAGAPTGACTGRSTLRTAAGDVSCYPYRCRAGRCLSSCQKDEDCAGSRGPAEMAAHGWPLACAVASATCFPLPPSHVNGHGPGH
jgi:hypothetical protein